MRKVLKLTLSFILSLQYQAFATHPTVELRDQFGNSVQDSGLPVDIRKSCGECHNVDFIATAYHVQQGRLALLTKEVYEKNYYSKYGDNQFVAGLPKELNSLDMGMYGKL